MNMQAIMKQAQKMQKDMIKDQEEIQNMIFEEENSQVYVKGNGKKEILEIKFKDMDSLDKDDLEMLSDSLVVVINKFIDMFKHKFWQKYCFNFFEVITL